MKNELLEISSSTGQRKTIYSTPSIPHTDPLLFRETGHTLRAQGRTFGPRITLPSIPAEDTQRRTDHQSVVTKRPLTASPLRPLPLPSIAKTPAPRRMPAEPRKAQPTPHPWRFSEGRDDEDYQARLIQTFPLRAVKKTRAKKRFSTFLATSVLFFTGIVVLSACVIVMIVVPSTTSKLQALTVFLIVCSYVLSFLVKRFFWTKQQKYLTMSQLTRAVQKAGSPGQEEDMKHLALIKQDTATFLLALNTKNAKKGVRS